PEVVQNKPYGDKADIWALGCILYQMATLQPPFYSSNMLSLASMIVEGVYEPVEEGAFSDRLTDMIRWCLSSDPEQRPDVVAVSSRISDLMMKLMDGLYISQNALQRRADKDRRRTQKYFLEKQQSRNNFCHSDMVNLDSRVFEHFALSRSGAHASNSRAEGQMWPPQLFMWPSRLQITSISPSSFSQNSQKITFFQIFTANFSQNWMNCFLFVSGSVGICVSQRKLRQIDDPIQRLLVQLHKIIFITQLPPAPNYNIKRRLVERFKKSLFHLGSDPYNLKVELRKVRKLSFPPSSTQTKQVILLRSSALPLQEIMEELLEENSYYQTKQI
uniref:NIMA-related kinase 10 n=1 Tax=Xiphophorus couchianus TaxID=32473 RepID=A0A3B5LP12_9TELE